MSISARLALSGAFVVAALALSPSAPVTAQAQRPRGAEGDRDGLVARPPAVRTRGRDPTRRWSSAAPR